VTLIVYYLIFMIAGDFAAYFLGLLVEYEWGSYASLIVFLVLYFLFLWVLAARGVGDQTKSGHTKWVLVGRRWRARYNLALSGRDESTVE
jgi:hypothetical protein